MTTIEDKISLFSKIIYDKVNEEKEERIGIVSSEIEKKINVEREKIKDLRSHLQREITKKSNVKANGIVAKERFNKQREVLLLKDELICHTVKIVREKLMEFVRFEDYKPYFINSLQKTLSGIDNGNYYIIVIKRDYDRFKNEIAVVLSDHSNVNAEIIISEEDFIGGLMLKDSQGKFKIDNSIESKLQECKELIGVRVMEILA